MKLLTQIVTVIILGGVGYFATKGALVELTSSDYQPYLLCGIFVLFIVLALSTVNTVFTPKPIDINVK